MLQRFAHRDSAFRGRPIPTSEFHFVSWQRRTAVPKPQHWPLRKLAFLWVAGSVYNGWQMIPGKCVTIEAIGSSWMTFQHCLPARSRRSRPGECVSCILPLHFQWIWCFSPLRRWGMYFGNCVSSVAISRRSWCSVFKSKCRKAKRNGSCLTAYPVFRMPCCAISTKPLQPPRVGLDLWFHSKFLLPLQACNVAEGEHHRLHRLHQPCGWTVFFDGCRRGIVRQLLAYFLPFVIRRQPNWHSSGLVVCCSQARWLRCRLGHMDIFSRACVDHALQFLQTALVAAPVLQGKLWVAQHLNSNGVVQHDCYLKAPLWSCDLSLTYASILAPSCTGRWQKWTGAIPWPFRWTEPRSGYWLRLESTMRRSSLLKLPRRWITTRSVSSRGSSTCRPRRRTSWSKGPKKFKLPASSGERCTVVQLSRSQPWRALTAERRRGQTDQWFDRCKCNRFLRRFRRQRSKRKLRSEVPTTQRSDFDFARQFSLHFGHIIKNP